MAITEVGAGSQRASQSETGASDTAAYPANVIAGNLLIAAGGYWSSLSTVDIGVTDSLSTPYTVLRTGNVSWGGGFGKGFLAYGVAPSSGACTVTAAVANMEFITWVIDEFTGTHATPLDVNGGESTGTSTTPSDGLTTLTAGALVVGTMVKAGGTGAITSGTGYTAIADDETENHQPFGSEFKVAGAAGAQTVDWLLADNIAWRVITAAFKDAAAGGFQAALARGSNVLLMAGRAG